MEELLTHIINVPLVINDETTCSKNTSSCESQTCDIAALNNTLIENMKLIDRLYSSLNNSPALNPLLSSYFVKIVGSFILSKTGKVFKKSKYLNNIRSNNIFNYYSKH